MNITDYTVLYIAEHNLVQERIRPKLAEGKRRQFDQRENRASLSGKSKLPQYERIRTSIYTSVSRQKSRLSTATASEHSEKGVNGIERHRQGVWHKVTLGRHPPPQDADEDVE